MTRSLITLVFAGIIVSQLSAAVAQHPPGAYVVTLPPNDPPGESNFAAVRHWQSQLTEQGILVDRCGTSIAARRFIVELENAEQLALVQALNLTIEPLTADSGAADPRGGPDSRYFDPDDISAILLQTAEDHPDITRVFTVGVTHEGRTILGIEISDNPGVDEDEPAVLLNGLHHARELVTPHIVVDAIDHLTDGYETGDPQIVQWVRNYKIICVPMVNPDGSARVFNGDLNHRKNLASACTATNPGVDLNRNYPYHWGSGASVCNRGAGSSGTACNDAYRGTAPASEPETQAMIALADAFQFAIAVSYHSSGEFIDYPYACNDGSPDNRMPEHALIDAAMRGMAAAIGAVNGTTYDVFSPIALGPVNGDDTSWYYAHKGVYPFIVETGQSFAPPFSQVAQIVDENRAGWLYLLNRLAQARIDVHVRAGCEPLAAEVRLLNYVYDTGELPRHASTTFGRWTFLVPPSGNYTVEVSHPDYQTSIMNVSVTNTPASLDVDLTPIVPPTPILNGDMNDDCIVDGIDVALFTAALLDEPSAPADVIQRGDFTGDCILNEIDLSPFVSAVLAGTSCP